MPLYLAVPRDGSTWPVSRHVTWQVSSVYSAYIGMTYSHCYDVTETLGREQVGDTRLYRSVAGVGRLTEPVAGIDPVSGSLASRIEPTCGCWRLVLGCRFRFN